MATSGVRLVDDVTIAVIVKGQQVIYVPGPSLTSLRDVQRRASLILNKNVLIEDEVPASFSCAGEGILVAYPLVADEDLDDTDGEEEEGDDGDAGSGHACSSSAKCVEVDDDEEDDADFVIEDEEEEDNDAVIVEGDDPETEEDETDVDEEEVVTGGSSKPKKDDDAQNEIAPIIDDEEEDDDEATDEKEKEEEKEDTSRVFDIFKTIMKLDEANFRKNLVPVPYIFVCQFTRCLSMVTEMPEPLATAFKADPIIEVPVCIPTTYQKAMIVLCNSPENRMFEILFGVGDVDEVVSPDLVTARLRAVLTAEDFVWIKRFCARFHDDLERIFPQATRTFAANLLMYVPPDISGVIADGFSLVPPQGKPLYDMDAASCWNMDPGEDDIDHLKSRRRSQEMMAVPVSFEGDGWLSLDNFTSTYDEDTEKWVTVVAPLGKPAKKKRKC